MVRFQSGRKKRLSAQARHRQGLSRPEVVLVLSIIVLFASILLRAIQTAREAARKDQCKSHLKQIGMAVLQYQESFGYVPAGFDINPHGDYLGWGWNLKILPFMDAVRVYRLIEPRLSGGIPQIPDSAELRKRIPFLCCPSDPGGDTIPVVRVCTSPVVDGVVTTGTAYWNNRLPRSNYVGNAGYLQAEYGGILPNGAGIPASLDPLANAGSLGNFGTDVPANARYCHQQHFGGYFGQNSAVKLAQVYDGTSNTLMVGERYSPSDLPGRAVGYGTWIGIPDCTSAQGLAMALGDASLRINIGMPLRESTTGFGSNHPGGSMFLMGEGAVRFLSDKIDVELYRNLAVIDDGMR